MAFLSIPLIYEYQDNQGNVKRYSEYWHVLPAKLKVKGTVDPQSLRRGIYEIVSYQPADKQAAIPAVAAAIDTSTAFEAHEPPPHLEAEGADVADSDESSKHNDDD